MKKTICFMLAFVLCALSGITAYAEAPAIKISESSAENTFNMNPYGIDLTNSDYGLSANLVRNGSFESGDNSWSFEGTQFVLGDSDPVSDFNTAYSVVNVQNSCVLKNHGYGDKNAMYFTEGERYGFSCNIKNIDFSGEVLIQLSSGRSSNIVKISEDTLNKKSWDTVSAQISAASTDMGELEITFSGSGSLQLDNVSLVPENSFGGGTEEWKYTNLREDTVQALKMLSPSFVMFSADGESWQSGIGDLSQRTDGADVGCHEYLQLCHDLNAEPIPTIDTDKIKSIENSDNYVQGVLDLIEYANADSITSYFGALRAGNGSEDSFDVKYIYLRGKGQSLGRIRSAVEEKYEGITVLTDNDTESICNITDYAGAAAKSNMGAGVLSGKAMISSESGFISYKNAIGFSGDESGEPYMITAGPEGISLSPEYYVQMLLSNNFGEEKIALPQIDEKITQTARLDIAKQILSVYLVNEGASKVIELVHDGFDGAEYVSAQSVSSAFKTTANITGKQRIAPEEKEIEPDGDNIKLELKSNSVTVVRIAYGGNTGSNLYTFPEELDLSTRLYIPAAVRIIAVVLAVSVPLGTVLGFFLYKNIISKKKRSVHGNE